MNLPEPARLLYYATRGNNSADPCSWYWINLLVDCTGGVFLIFILLQLQAAIYSAFGCMQQRGLIEEVMGYRTYCCASAKTQSGFPVEAREGTKPRNRHSFLVNPFYIPF